MFDHQMVIKFLDGKVIKGFGPLISHGEVVMDFQDLNNNIQFIDLTRVKAVFFVRSLEGLHTKERKGDRRETRSMASGERVVVRFADGEKFHGIMTNPDSVKNAKGFYVTTTEEGSNNYRIYANRSAVEAVLVNRMGLEINLLA